jgi:hypothetical protein
MIFGTGVVLGDLDGKPRVDYRAGPYSLTILHSQVPDLAGKIMHGLL